MIVEMLKVPRPGDFLGGLREGFPSLLFFGLRLSVARHERESGGAHVMKCDTFGSRLAYVGDEIVICPGDLSRSLALGFLVLRCLFRDL